METLINGISVEHNKKLAPVAIAHIYGIARKSYIEVAVVRDNNNIGPFVPLSKRAMRKILVATMSDESIRDFSSMFIPENLLAYNATAAGRYIVWYNKPQLRSLTFEGKLHKMTGFWKMPMILYIVSNDSMILYALKGNTRPNLNSEVFYAPVFNTSGYLGPDPSICWGSVKINLEGLSVDSEMAQWERYFWTSKFNTDGDYLLKNLHLSDHYVKWKGKNKLLIDSPGIIETRRLLSTNQNLNQIINKFIS